MPLKPIDTLPSGGVDSWSNPVQMPPNRYLRCRNLVPLANGGFRLRDGYSQIPMTGAIDAVAIHSPLSYFDGATGIRYVLFWQGSVPKKISMVDFTVSNITVKGTAISSSHRWAYALAQNGHLVAFNGTDKKWFDGTYWRDVGIRALTDSEVVNVGISPGSRELSSAENTAITLTDAAGGTFNTMLGSGMAIFVCLFDTDHNEIGPATQPCGSGRIACNGSGRKVTVTGLPNLGAQHYVKLIARTGDSQFYAYLSTNSGPTTITSCVRSGTTLTVTAPGHTLSNGFTVVTLRGTGNFDGIFSAMVTNASTLQITLTDPIQQNAANTTGGSLRQALWVSAAGTSVDIIYTNWDTYYVANQDLGLPAADTTSTQPGYVFYAAIYNTVTQHVGNRKQLGTRYVPSVRANVRFTGLPDMSLTDSEWALLIGRTDDAGAVPYISTDSGANFVVIKRSTPTLTYNNTDESKELPMTNGLPPAFDKVWREADHMCGVTLNSPTVWRSGSELDARNGDFVGLPEQAWYEKDIETFPTGEVIMGGAGYELESWTGTLNDFGILTELAGDLQWKGPWRIGLGGQFCFARGWSSLPYWITGDRQLAVGTSQGAEPISIEYEAALLDQIGDSALGDTETVYFRRPADQTEILVIKARDNSGSPFLIIHDFNLRDGRSAYGQAYEFRYQGALASDFTICPVRNNAGRQEVWAASGNQFYRLFDGGNDNGTEFLGEAINLYYAGPYRPKLSQIEWYGDSTAEWFVNKRLDTQLEVTDFDQLTKRSVVKDEHNSHWTAAFEEELTHAYVWLQLRSHSADGSVALSNPPHIPLESYGRVWVVTPQIGNSNPK